MGPSIDSKKAQPRFLTRVSAVSRMTRNKLELSPAPLAVGMPP
jgi:hypothetical protein